MAEPEANEMTKAEADFLADVITVDAEMRGLKPEAVGAVDAEADCLRWLTGDHGEPEESHALVPRHALNAANARAEREHEAVDAWMRFAHHAADRRWTIPLWGALLWERAIDASNAALAGDAPGRVA